MTKREATDEERDIANRFKSEGNQLMKEKKFKGEHSQHVNHIYIISEAVERYSEAINVQESAIYYCNRAAAYGRFPKNKPENSRFRAAGCLKHHASDLQALPNKAPHRSILARYGLTGSVRAAALIGARILA